MTYTYDNQNIFAKILRSEIPNDTVLENEFALAFKDIAPQAPIHVLVVPKGPYVCYDHFLREGSDEEILGLNNIISKVIDKLNLSPSDGKGGYRIISNAGADGVQDVPHFHIHILGGQLLGRMLENTKFGI